MANTEPDTGRDNRHDNRHELERLTARYADDFRAGKAPRIEDYIRRYPQYAVELGEFFVYFHTVGEEAIVPDAVPAPQLSPAAQKAMARIRQQYTQQTALDSLTRQGIKLNLAPPQLAERVGLSTDVILRLEARAIAAASIPRTLIQRLAAALQVRPDAVVSFLSGASGLAEQPGFYYADQAPTQRQDNFLDAIRASSQLSAEGKAEWERIVHEEIG